MKKQIILLVMMAATLCCYGQANVRHNHHNDDPRGGERHHRDERRPSHDRHDTFEGMEVLEALFPGTPGGGQAPAAEWQVALILDYIKGVSFSSDKVKAAQLMVTILPIGSRDLIRIMDLLSFEKDKVELLKTAYAMCPDKDRFYLAVNTLSFQSSRDEVYEYIR